MSVWSPYQHRCGQCGSLGGCRENGELRIWSSPGATRQKRLRIKNKPGSLVKGPFQEPSETSPSGQHPTSVPHITKLSEAGLGLLSHSWSRVGPVSLQGPGDCSPPGKKMQPLLNSIWVTEPQCSSGTGGWGEKWDTTKMGVVKAQIPPPQAQICGDGMREMREGGPMGPCRMG